MCKFLKCICSSSVGRPVIFGASVVSIQIPTDTRRQQCQVCDKQYLTSTKLWKRNVITNCKLISEILLKE